MPKGVHTKKVVVKCLTCGKDIHTNESKVLIGKAKYCSKRCCSVASAKRPSKRKYDDQFLIDEFWRFYRENGRYPLGKDLKGNDDYPNFSVYTRRWDGWFDFLNYIGVLGDKEWYKCDEDVIRKYYADGNKEVINAELMVKRKWAAITQKANSMGITVKKEVKYKSKYNKNALKSLMVKDARDFYSKNNRSPHMHELNYERLAFRVNWPSYNDFLVECDLPIVRREIAMNSDEEAISFLKSLSVEIGRRPNCNDVINAGIHPNWFAKRFGSFTKALYAANLVGYEKIMTIPERVNTSIDLLRFLFNSKGRIPSVDEYIIAQKKNTAALTYTNLQIHLNMNYAEICTKYLGVSRYNQKDKETLTKELLNAVEIHGRAPMAKELVSFELESHNIYIHAFEKPFNVILKNLGIAPSGHDPTFRTDEELINDYCTLFAKLGRLPFADDLTRHNGTATYGVYKKRIGSIFDICDAANIDWKRHILEKPSGQNSFYYLDRNNDLCRSRQEMIVTNILIDNDIKYEKEVLYKDHILADETKRTFDWYLPEFNVFVEYFGLFQNQDRLRKDECYTTKALRKIEDCKNNEISLVSLYPQDVRRDYRHVVSKFRLVGVEIIIQKSKEHIA